MGVHSFWDIVGPTAKPVRLESLEDKVMAVDASIWIYQFLKAVRDNEGNSVNNAHIVGFFRRICKLLYFGVKPVFVFDGGVPVLKRETIRQRKERRQGQRENAVLTARKLLAIQLQKQLHEDKHSKNGDSNKLSTLEDNFDRMTNFSSMSFKPHDEWDLPDIAGFKVDKDDTRILSTEKYDDILNSIEDGFGGVDLETINPASKEFEELPVATQYMILTNLRLKSRLRLGYTKEQLENIFPTSMQFSKFQIDMVRRRNFFTQKLLATTDAPDGGASKFNDEKLRTRIAGQLNKEYSLSKTDQGWALGLQDVEGLRSDKPLELISEEDLYSNQDDFSIKKDKEIPKKTNTFPGDHMATIEDDEDDFEWEEVDTKVVKDNKIEDFSLKAAKLSQFNKPANNVGSRAFLDAKHNIKLSPVKKPSISKLPKVYQISSDSEEESFKYIAGNKGYNENSEEDDDDFNQQIKEIEMMETIKKKITSPAFITKANQGRDRATLSTRGTALKNNDFLKPSNLNQIASTSVQSNKIEQTEYILPEPTTERKLDYIMSRIPGFDQVNPTNSMFFNNSKVTINENKEINKDDSTEKSAKEVVETPVWFQEKSDMPVNPYSSTEFVHDKTNRKDTANKNSKGDGYVLYSGVAADEFLNDHIVDSQTPIKNPNNNDDDDIIIISSKEKGNNNTDKDSVTVDAQDDFSTKINCVSESSESDNESQIASSHQDSNKISNKIPAVFEYDFSEDEQNDIVENIIKEGQEFNEFKTNLNETDVSKTFMEDDLFEQQVKSKRDSDEVTQDMIKSVQELLTRFGIPYIVAPMEAEAQCAELLKLKLVDGIITDDSDVFLFGGSKVYKNMFHEKNYVEFYDQDKLTVQLGLERSNLIDLALLLGSDYTSGIKGIGPVSGIEIIAEFGSLENFRDWYMDGQFDKNNQKTESKFQKDLRKKLVKNEIILDSNFPSAAVRNAYLYPEVDSDKTNFTWGVPDLDMLRTFMLKEVRWTQEKSDEVLIPLIKDINKRKRKPKQKRLTDFFPTELISTEKMLNMGKRVLTATNKLKKGNFK
ncbi:hypothetical protein TPHA_0H01260 [Tetrapisispora phaffii CBS 4417]|uniref:DNA repair protein RAD2 n=1 Tax=Tetrapisispora phaffii (strain ATCC 24235 / CBS 4417 / NBRC 1672 / NRRL Y-8282 / UCD 70-5) TaxID=1071381 RepID=G8BX30_TETPH|nr:hypothetical protein TPHA_0H01260 [Tetrapisispora phaffii CBS 4417]CCE64334.1 hypothetical protein TPHA_0H01260 [Tetrapisispora phaffii CBS 4417]